MDISLGPAFLLGLDVAALPPSRTERGLMERFLSIAVDESSTVCLRLLRLDSLVDHADDLLNARLDAFRRSLSWHQYYRAPHQSKRNMNWNVRANPDTFVILPKFPVPKVTFGPLKFAMSKTLMISSLNVVRTEPTRADF